MRINLKTIHTRLVARLGKSAPSYVTIKRMSAAGRFSEMGEGAVMNMLCEKYASEDMVAPAAPVTQVPADAQRLQEMEKQMEIVQAQNKQLQAAINQLASVRTTMMMKYDSLCSQQLQTIEAQRAHIKELQQSSTLTMEVSRISGQLQRLIEKTQ